MNPRIGDIPVSGRLTILCSGFDSDQIGGVQSRMLRMARAFARRGVEVRVLTESAPNRPDVESLDPGLTVHRRPGPAIGWRWRWRDVLRLAWWHRRVREEVGPGWIWASGPVMATAAILAGRRADTVFSPGACATMMQKLVPVLDAPKMAMPAAVRWMERFAYHRCAHVMVASDNLRRQFDVCYGPREMALIPFGVDAPPGPPRCPQAQRRSRVELGVPPDAFVVGFVGRLDRCKDLPFLLEAARHAKRVPNLHLLVVGDGADLHALQEHAKRLDLADRVTWTGTLLDPEPAYAAMDVFVLPSVYETFGLVLLEARVAGLPVIGRGPSLDNHRPVWTAVHEIITHDDDGLLAASNDPADMGRLIESLHAEPQRRARMGQRARSRVLERTWDDVVHEYAHLLNLQRTGHLARAA